MFLWDKCFAECIIIIRLCRGLCSDSYPDEVCRANYSLHYYDPPLLYDLNSDPGEIYNLNVKEHVEVMTTIEKVRVHSLVYLVNSEEQNISFYFS